MTEHRQQTSAAGRLPILHAVKLVYGDAVRVVRAMPGLALIAVLTLAATNTAEFLIGHYFLLSPVTDFVKEAGLRITESVLLTPILIAIHRFILLNQATARYSIALFHPRFERFLVWSLLLWVLMASVRLVLHPLLLSGVSPTFALAAAVAAFVIVLVVSARLTVLFPAIAVDAPGATASNAFADTRGHVLAIVFIGLLATLPVFAVLLVAGFLLVPARALMGDFLADATASAVVLPFVQAFAYVVAVAIASRVFQALAERVRRVD